MLPQDLRIGNLVYDSVRNKEVQIELKHFRELYISEKMFFERYKAIELNDEKLLAFGFNKRNFGISITTYMNLVYDDSQLIFECEDSFYSFELEHVKYAHELQNLYYSLKNEELQIT